MTGVWLSPEQAADRTPLSRKAIYGAIQRGELPASKRARRWMIAEDDLERWVTGGAPRDPGPAPAGPRPRRSAPRQARGSLAALRAIEGEGS